MTSRDSNSNGPKPANNASISQSTQFQFVEFISKEDALRKPESRQRNAYVVRANAKKYALSQQRNLNAAHSAVGHLHFRRLDRKSDPPNVNNPNPDSPGFESTRPVKLEQLHPPSSLISAQLDTQNPTNPTDATQSNRTKNLHSSTRAIKTYPGREQSLISRSVQARLSKGRGSATVLKDSKVSGWGNQLRLQHLIERYSSPQTILRSGKFDPFNSLPAQMTPYFHYLVDYCKFLLSSFSLSPHLRRQAILILYIDHSVIVFQLPVDPNTGLTHAQMLLPIYMQNEMAFRSMLVIAEVSVCSYVKQSNPWSTLGYSLKLDCIKEVRRELDKPIKEISDALLLTVCCIATAEIIWGDKSNYQNHLKGIRTMVKLRGGFNSLSKLFKDNVNWVFKRGGEDINTEEHEEPSIIQEPRVTSLNNLPRRPSPVSDSLVQSLGIIKSLSAARDVPSSSAIETEINDHRNKFISIQNQLQSLYSQPKRPFLEAFYILAAFNYIELVFPSCPINDSKWGIELQKAFYHMQFAPEWSENEDVFLLVADMRDFSLRHISDQAKITSLIKQFDKIVTRLETFSGF